MLARSLSGIRVLDLTKLFPGPLCTLMLSDLGADVIKIEAPEGELARYFPPYQFGIGATFLQLNRGKRAMTLNLKKEKAVDIFKRLLERADVFVESFRPGTMKRFKLDYETLREMHPSLIYCSISGYGQTGPDADRPGHDLNYISIAGIVALSGSNQKGHLIPPVQIADVLGGFQATNAILAALIQRSREEKGQYLDISLLDGAFFSLVSLASLYFAGMPLESGSLPLSGRLACYNVYRTKDDRYLALALLEPKFWQTFCLKMKFDRYIAYQLQEDQSELIRILSETIASKTLQDWLDFFRNDDLCVSPVNDFVEAISDPQILSRQLLMDISYPSGVLKQLKTPFVQNPENVRRAPLLGEHTVDILTELGYSDIQIDSFRKEGVL